MKGHGEPQNGHVKVLSHLTFLDQFFLTYNEKSYIKLLHYFIASNHKKLQDSKNIKMAWKNELSKNKEIGISTSDISDILSKFHVIGIILDQSRYSHPQKLQSMMGKKLINTAKAQLKNTTKQVMDEWDFNLNIF